ncbi:MAG: hypothetical protein ACRCXB_00330 [Aeromonadaceae bacterium]
MNQIDLNVQDISDTLSKISDITWSKINSIQSQGKIASAIALVALSVQAIEPIRKLNFSIFNAFEVIALVVSIISCIFATYTFFGLEKLKTKNIQIEEIKSSWAGFEYFNSTHSFINEQNIEVLNRLNEIDNSLKIIKTESISNEELEKLIDEYVDAIVKIRKSIEKNS